MTPNSNGMTSGTKIRSIQDLKLILEDDLDQLTDDELHNAPLSLVEAMLDRMGVPRTSARPRKRPSPFELRALTDLDDAADGRTLHEVRPARPEGFAETLLAKLRLHSRIALQGPAGSGKSLFVREAFLTNTKVRAQFPRVVFIDCEALQMESIWQFQREAVWAQFGNEDEAFRNFLAGLSKRFGDGSLLALIERRLRNGGLIVIDGANRLSRTGEIAAWIDGSLLPLADSLGAAVLITERLSTTNKPFSRARALGFQALDLPALSLDDIDAWLFQPALRYHLATGPEKSRGLTAHEVQRLTGGAPSLLRDLGNYLLDPPLRGKHRLHGKEALRAFALWRLRMGYMADCDRFLRAARHSHVLLEHVLGDGRQLLSKWELDAKLRTALLGTGAVKEKANGTLGFISPLYARRIRTVLQPKNLAFGLMRAKLHELLQSGDLHKLRDFSELAADALARCISRERRPKDALLQLEQLLVRWGFEPTLYIRDRGNARLWAPFHSPEQVGPFVASQQPFFARAVQTGRVTGDDLGRVYLPLVGNSGIVEAVVTGNFHRRDLTTARRAIEIDRLAGLMRGMRPTLLQVLERLALRQERKFQDRLMYKAAAVGGLMQEHVLREARCQSLAILQQRGENWFLAKFERIGTAEESEIDFCWAESAEANRLSMIMTHPSRRGLVLAGAEVWVVFPRLKGIDTTVYIQPVRRDHKHTALVAFLFANRNVGLDGRIQERLAGIAPNVIAVA